MICIGYSQGQKAAAVAGYCAANEIGRTVVIAPAQLPLQVACADQVTWAHMDKVRNGPVGSVPIFLEGNHQVFTDVSAGHVRG